MTYSVKSIRFPLLLYILKFILNKNGSNRKFSFMLLLSVYLTPLYSQTGYLREAEASFCMDDCGIYYLEDEYGEFITWVTLLDNLEMLEPYVHRFVDIEGEEVTCVECTAINVSSISMSDSCEFPVECFADPCTVEDCALYPDAECVANYCDGCWADFYIDGELLLDCHENVGCIDLTGIYFGDCDMVLGIGWSDNYCQVLSGCGWVVDGMDYTDAFFTTMEECYAVCSETPPQESISIDYLLGWNLVGLPLEVEDTSYGHLFPESTDGTLYSFENGYISESYFIPGKGYWLRFTSAGSTTITGSPISELTITLTEGWNLISGITNSVDVSDIQAPSGIIIPGTVYGFSFNGYSNAESIEPGKGYWLRTYQSGDIILTSQTPATVTDIDGNVYNTVSIGDQLWMAENLKVTHYQNGDEMPYSYNDPQYGAYAEYNNDASNVAVYGRLYNWFAVNDARGLCPVDWQVPSDDELQELEMYLGMSESEANSEGLRGTDEGGKLKEEGTEHWNSPNTGATNETGFTAFPGGRRDYDPYTNQEVWCCLNRYGFFWSSSEIYSVNAWYRALSFDYSESNRYHLSKRNGFSVRCIRDDIAMAGGPLIKDLPQTFNLTGKANTLSINGSDLYFGIELSARERLSYSLPPKPPVGAIDIRFSGDTKLCSTDECVIEVMNNGSSLTFECEIKNGESWELVEESGKVFQCSGIQVLELISDTKQFILRKGNLSEIPTEFSLFPVYPNPFNSITTIRFSVGSMHASTLNVYDINGRLVETLLDDILEPDHHIIQWNASKFSSGVYFVQLTSDGEMTQTQKVILLK